MSLIVSQKEHNTLKEQFNAKVAELNLVNEKLSAAEELVSTHEKTIETLTAEKQEAVEALQNANVETLNTRISELEAENAELKKGPGAETAISVAEADANLKTDKTVVSTEKSFAENLMAVKAEYGIK